MSRIITIVGASVRAAASSARRAGFSIHAADLFADVDLRRQSLAVAVADYPAGLEAAIVGPHGGGWIFTGGLENYPDLVDRWSRSRPLWGNTGEILRRVRDPELVATALRESGLHAPHVTFDGSTASRDGRWLIKHLRSSGGTDVVVWDEQTSAPSPAEQLYFQQFIPGDPCSAVYVGAGGVAILLGVTRQLIGTSWTGGSGMRYCGSVGPLVFAESLERQFQQIGRVLAKEFNLRGLFGVDAVVNDQGVWPIEVNPRYTASIEVLERACGFHSLDLHMAACETGSLPKPHRWPRSAVCGKAILFAESALRVPADIVDWCGPDAKGAWPSFADIPAPDVVIKTGWPIMTVLAAAGSERETLDLLKQGAAELRQRVAERS